VQHALLKIMEGAPVKIKDGALHRHHADPLHLRRRLRRLDDILAKTRSFGFISTSEATTSNSSTASTARVKPTDLFEFGLIPEFAGRLPIVASLKPLSREMLVRIMTEPPTRSTGSIARSCGPTAWNW
jgi:ATP-dependent Clp protease ATP-binding subunit ClpX